LKPAHVKYTVHAGDVRFTFWNSGDVHEISCRDIMINQLLSSPVDGSLNNLYLRLHRPEGIAWQPLVGARSDSRVSVSGRGIAFEGRAFGKVDYRVVFAADEAGIWFWDIRLQGHGEEVDVVCGQDLGLAAKGAVRGNEAYMSQYIDHKAFRDGRKGYIVCSRQNQPQGGKLPYVQQGSLTGCRGYATDGFQFFGLSYKATNEPEALGRESLANEIYQYEFAYTALQSERVKLDGEARIVFYGLFREDHPEPVAAPEYGDAVEAAWRRYEAREEETYAPAAPVPPLFPLGEPLQPLPMTEEEIASLFPKRVQEERENGRLLSFFTEKYEHVVLREKELKVERPHGIILMSGGNDRVTEQVLSTTSYMYGVFNSQMTVGNTTFHKFLSNTRNALNVTKLSGQRIFVEMDGVWRMLGLPSMFEMGFNSARWTYKLGSDTIVVENFTAADAPEAVLRVASAQGKKYRFLVTHQVVMNDHEYDLPFRMERDGRRLTFRADPRALSARHYPDLAFRLRLDGAEFEVSDEAADSASLIVLSVGESDDWTLTMQGLLHGGELPETKRSLEREAERYRAFLSSVMRGFRLAMRGEETPELQKMNAIAWWYTHNMLVHFSVPHGLEQYGGAAWGTRDVCQGPAEYFTVTQHFGVVRDILKIVFSHQYEDDGNWPQWFMFDRYAAIQQEESHGDIIVWPLKVLGDYLLATGDASILDERVPYTVRGMFAFTGETVSIRDHVRKAVEHLHRHFLHGTRLSAYGGGDWDDTLQPANRQLKRFMVSSWTVALTYQAIRQLSGGLPADEREWAEELAALADGIREDFHRMIMRTDVVPGFIYMERPDEAEMMLHPEDRKTGIRYRLLPMQQSIISELFTREQAEYHCAVIKEKLYHPDGVRLMDRPAHYDGGNCKHFRRAEQAANFGREIGLQYVHAHIRFVEAMAKLGMAEEAWNGLMKVNPVGLRSAVPNAELRQSNVYFSSSDGKFNTRYEAERRFEELRAGRAAVKGGWRIYSSGPGIYLNQLIANCLGIRQLGGDLVIDPVLPGHLDGLEFDFVWTEAPVRFVYHLNSESRRVVVNGREIPAHPLPGMYRQGGLRVAKEEFAKVRSNQWNIVEIFI
jgi:Cellobiose phosphorylase